MLILMKANLKEEPLAWVLSQSITAGKTKDNLTGGPIGKDNY